MPMRFPARLLLASLLGLALTEPCLAQQPFLVTALEFRDPLLPGASNQTVSLTASSGTYFLGATCLVSSGNLVQISTSVMASSAGIRLTNGGHPGAWADFKLTSASFVGGTLALTSSTRPMTGPLVHARISLGSTMAATGFCDVTTGYSGVARITGSSIAFSTNAGPSTSNSIESFAYPGPVQPPISTSSTIGQVSVAMSATGAYIIEDEVLVRSVTLQPLVTSTLFSDVRIRVRNSAFPSVLNCYFSPVNSAANFASLGLGSPLILNEKRIATLSSGLPGVVIPVGSTWTFNPNESVDQNLDGLPDAILSNLNFDFNFNPLYVANSSSLVGPFTVNGYPGSNSTFTIGSALTSFPFGSTVRFTGSGNEVNTQSSLSQTRLRIRNSAFPGISAEFQPTTSSATLTVVTNASLNSPTTVSTSLGSLLRGMVIPAGSIFSGELYDVFDDPGIDSQWSGLQVSVFLGSPLGSSTPPVATDLGWIDNVSLTSPVTGLTGPFTGGSVSWFKFSLATAVSRADGRFLDLWTSQPGTTGYSSDTAIALYDSGGRLRVFSDDDGGGPALMSAMSFGVPLQTTAPWVVTQSDLAFNGRSGDGLPAGTYYLAVVEFPASGVSDGFAISGGATTNLGSKVNLRCNLPAANVTLSGSVELADVVSSFAYPRVLTYKLKQGTSMVASGTLIANTEETPFNISVPSSVTGFATLEFDGMPFLRRKPGLLLTGSAVILPGIVLLNGDVDGSGEVDAADIDQVIADFGATADVPSDVDVSGEVDAADIDIVIANFGAVDE